MKSENEGIERIEKIKRYREKHLRCGRCGSLNTLYSAVREEMSCRQCGNKWSVRQEEMEKPV